MPVLAAAIGAGVGSIYRMVGAKEDVIAALVIERALALVERFTAACDEPDAWAALQRVTYVTAQDGATDFLSQTAWDDAADRRADVADARAQATAALEALVERARCARPPTRRREPRRPAAGVQVHPRGGCA